MNTANSIPATTCDALNVLQTAVWVHDLQTLQPIWANLAALQIWHTPTLEAFQARLSTGWNPVTQQLTVEVERIRRGEAVQHQHTVLIQNEGIHLTCRYSKVQLQASQDVLLVEAFLSPSGMPGGATSPYPTPTPERADAEQTEADKEVQRISSQSVLWHGYITDISDRKQVELALQRQKEILDAIFDQVSIMLAFCNPDGQVEVINRELKNVLGWSLADWQHRDIFTQCYPDATYRRKALQHMQVANGQWQDFKTCTATGALIDTSWSSIRLSDGSLIYIGQNISDRKQVEERLRLRGKRDRLLGLIVQRIRQSLDLKDVLDTAVSEIRAMLNTDQVLIYRFEPDGQTSVVAESVSPNFPTLLGHTFPAISQQTHPLGIEQVLDYTWNIADVPKAVFSDPKLACFTDLKVQALLALPILKGDLQWGGLAVQQYTRPRDWQLSETDLLTQLTNQIAIAIQQSELYQQLQHSNQELQYLASHDPLTHLANRRYFDTYLEHEWHRLARAGAPLAILICDVDYFKAYNDTHGHIAGDNCLSAVAHAIRHATRRPSDLVARYGGEEFAIILPETPLPGAVRIAKVIQEAIQDLQIPHSASPISPYLTLSLGIAVECPQPTTTPQKLVAKADRALYTAKAEGRNRYCVGS